MLTKKVIYRRETLKKDIDLRNLLGSAFNGNLGAHTRLPAIHRCQNANLNDQKLIRGEQSKSRRSAVAPSSGPAHPPERGQATSPVRP